MATFDTSIFINRPPQEVWDYFTNPANDNQWGTAEHAEWTSEGLPGVGSTIRSVGKLLGRDVESSIEITVWDPPKEYAYKSTSGPFPFEATMILEPKENGTQLNAHLIGEVEGWLKMAGGLLMKQLEKVIDTNFEALKKVLEAG
jgi:carbon monoxide dehydrogenase subunit G